MAETAPGKRVEYTEGPVPPPGSFWRRDGVWFARTPAGLLGNLANHSVTEHVDGTITVSPSIVVNAPGRSSGPTSWHGYLERGQWREC